MLDTTARIRELAYRMWEDEGRPIDRQLDHWLQAEQLMTSAPPVPERAPRARKKAAGKK
jgi:hypothetical protein